MGKFSRDKGARNERSLVSQLIGAGWQARRVPLSGAMKGYKFDVVAEKDEVKFNIEVKTRNAAFQWLYTLIAERDVMHFSCGEFYVCLCKNLKDLEMTNHIYNVLEPNFYKKIRNLYNLNNGADVLAVKDDRKPFLFLGFRKYADPQISMS